MRIEEERESRGELVQVQLGIDRRLHIGNAVAKSERDFLHCRRTRLPHVIARDGNRVPFRDVFIRPGEHVGNDPHGVRDRENVGTARDVFLEDVVLDGAGKMADVCSLAAGHGDVEGKQDRSGGIDGHRSGDLGQVDAREQALHVFERVNGDADFSHFAERERAVGVQANLRGQIESDGKSRRAVGQQVLVPFVGFFGVAHPGILPHGPEPAPIHGGLHAPRVREIAWVTDLAVVVPALKVRGGIERVDRNTRRGLRVPRGHLGTGSFRLLTHLDVTSARWSPGSRVTRALPPEHGW